MKRLYEHDDIQALANSIKSKANTSSLYSLSGLKTLVDNLKTVFTTEEKSVTPTESVQEITPTSGDGLSKVTVGAISNTYVGSSIDRRSSTNLTASGDTITAPAGYYASAASKAVTAGSAGTPSASKGTVSNNQITITPSVTNTTGYITGGTKTGTGVTVSASELVSGSQNITENDTYDVTNLAQVIVNIANSGSGSLPTGFTAIATGSHTLSSDTNGTWTVTHNLGVAPDLFLIYRSNGNIAQTYSALWAMRCSTMAYRGSTYLNYCGYHGNSTTSVSVGNSTSRPVNAVSATTVTMSYYSSATYYWRAGTYQWIAIKFS